MVHQDFQKKEGDGNKETVRNSNNNKTSTYGRKFKFQMHYGIKNN